MTTSIMKNTVGKDLIITDHEQLERVFTQWYDDYGTNEGAIPDLAKAATQYLTCLLRADNEK